MARANIEYILSNQYLQQNSKFSKYFLHMVPQPKINNEREIILKTFKKGKPKTVSVAFLIILGSWDEHAEYSTVTYLYGWFSK